MKLTLALEKLRQVIRRQHLSLSTEETYCQWITRFPRFVSERCPTGSPEEKTEALGVRGPLEFATP